MTKRQDRDAIYVKRQFDTEIIVLCVRWYITYRLSYRDLVALMAERGVIMSHTTIMRWVIRYVPEFEKRWNRFARSGSGASAGRAGTAKTNRAAL
jgi:transposase-like protein